MTFFKPVAVALALTAFGVSPAVAQEQENPSTPGQIPDPGTYQGSTVLQQQSDQQDQSFRQQQQQAQDQAYGQSPAPQQPSAAAGTPRGVGMASPQRPVRATHIDPSDPAGAALERGDYATAFRLTHDAVMRDHNLNAMKNLGNLYEDGLGTRKNVQLAVRWYRSCADLGTVACQVELSRVHWVGIGVQRDPVEAYKWALIAGRPGGFKQALFSQNSEYQRQNAGAMRHDMAFIRNGLSYEQLSEATRRYQMWTPSDSIRPPELPAPQRHH